MKQHLNTLFVTTQDAYLARDGEAVVVKVQGESRLRVPLHHLAGIVCFGTVSVSPWLMARCSEGGVSISFMSQTGRLLGTVQGFTPGNVLLRREQYRRADDPERSLAIARHVIAAKVSNSRVVLLRAARDRPEDPGSGPLQTAAARLLRSVELASAASSADQLLGIEGDAADTYFGVFDQLITNRDGFRFTGRNRRPPRDSVNALLSFLYSLLAHDARSACEASGLDAAVGFFHRDRPGRPSLALDLMEELRAFLVDRLALSLINRRQLEAAGFTAGETGGVVMDEETRKVVLMAYQKRKQESLTHQFLGEEVTVGLIVHLQARLLARHLRGDLDAYPPFIWR